MKRVEIAQNISKTYLYHLRTYLHCVKSIWVYRETLYFYTIQLSNLFDVHGTLEYTYALTAVFKNGCERVKHGCIFYPFSIIYIHWESSINTMEPTVITLAEIILKLAYQIFRMYSALEFIFCGKVYPILGKKTILP